MEKNYLKLLFGLGLVPFVALNTAQAQDTTKTLNTVVVTATRSPKKLSEIGRVVTVISAEEINRSQGKSLPQLLNNVAGLTFSGANNAPGIATSIYLRGASTGNTLILVDGFPVNNASAIDGSYDLNAFSLDLVDHIEILKGAGSTLYGSDAVAGVINIITKKGKTQGLNGSLQLTGGSYNTFKEAASLTGRVKNTAIAINLSNTDSKGFPAAADTTGNTKEDGFHQRSASVNLSQYLSDKFILNGNLQVSHNTGNLPYGSFVGDNDYTYKNTFVLGGIDAKLILPKGALNVNVSQNTVQNGFINLPSDNDGTHQVTKNTGRITNAEAVFNYGLNKYLDITSGAAFKYSNTNQYSLYQSNSYQGQPSTLYAANNIFSAYTSLFFKYEIFHLELGGRYNNHSKYGEKFTYTVNPSLFLADQFKIFGTVASAFKSPSLYQLFSEYRNPETELNPEITTSYEAGFDWEILKNELSFNTQFFKRNTKDVIYFFSESQAPYRSFYKNGQLQKDKGFESELKYHAKGINASAYYAYVTGKLTDETGAETSNLYRRPKSTIGANVSYQLLDNFSFGVNYKYTGNRPDQDFSTYPTTVVTLKHYNLVDVHLEYNATKNLNVFGDLNNVFDTKYVDWLGYNTRGINFMLGARYQFK